MWLELSATLGVIEARIVFHSVDVVVDADGRPWVRLPESLEIGRVPPKADGPPRIQVNADTVSKRHCAIELRDGRYWVLDRGSTGGTSVNESVVKSAPHVLAEGDVLHLGAPVGSPKAIFRTSKP